MTPSIVKYQFVANERARNTTLQKRKASLMKKMSELRCLCDVEGSLVMYEKEEDRADVWPSLSEAWRLIQRFQDSSMMAARPTIDQKSFLQKKISKMKKHLEKEKGKNLKRSMIRCAFDEFALAENNQEALKEVCDALESEINLVDLMIKKAFEKGKEKLV